MDAIITWAKKIIDSLYKFFIQMTHVFYNLQLENENNHILKLFQLCKSFTQSIAKIRVSNILQEMKENLCIKRINKETKFFQRNSIIMKLIFLS